MGVWSQLHTCRASARTHDEQTYETQLFATHKMSFSCSRPSTSVDLASWCRFQRGTRNRTTSAVTSEVKGCAWNVLIRSRNRGKGGHKNDQHYIATNWTFKSPTRKNVRFGPLDPAAKVVGCVGHTVDRQTHRHSVPLSQSTSAVKCCEIDPRECVSTQPSTRQAWATGRCWWSTTLCRTLASRSQARQSVHELWVIECWHGVGRRLFLQFAWVSVKNQYSVRRDMHQHIREVSLRSTRNLQRRKHAFSQVRDSGRRHFAWFATNVQA